MGTHLETHSALYIFGISGLVSVLLDLDHFAALLLWEYWNPQITEGRIWHAPLFVFTGIAICCLLSLGRGFYPKLVLIGVAVVTILVLVYSPLVTWGLIK